MIPGSGSKGAQGYELQYVTNVLGPYLFTKLLLPVLKKTAASCPNGAVRVCWASSLATDLYTSKGGITFAEDGSPIVKGEGGGNHEYGVSKVANYFLGYEFGKRFGNADGVLHNVSLPPEALYCGCLNTPNPPIISRAFPKPESRRNRVDSISSPSTQAIWKQTSSDMRRSLTENSL
jgi:NAD(P)-dependent dehydrogenase (short-subunit alcohol dehydrogenase family)